MGSGKTTVGPLLAEAIGYRFFDLDEYIEARLGKSIAQIFKEEGEPFFRAIEREVLIDLTRENYAVISLGGGTIVNEENLAWARQHGVLVCLSATTEELYRRVADSDKRPLLEGPGPGRPSQEEIYRRMDALLAYREPYYGQADLFVDTTGKSQEQVVQEIVLLFEEFSAGLSQ
jgi:shikimate kinase